MTIHVLIVDDDAKLSKIVCTYLNDSGFQAKGCLNAHDAYDEMYNNPYELIISDIMMPEVDGFEFALNEKLLAAQDAISDLDIERSNHQMFCDACAGNAPISELISHHLSRVVICQDKSISVEFL